MNQVVVLEGEIVEEVRAGELFRTGRPSTSASFCASAGRRKDDMTHF